MQLTKFSHSCVRLDQDGSVLVVDPGGFSEVDEALDGADVILITHEHPDHIDQERVVAFLQANAAVELWAPAGVIDALGDALDGATDRLHAVGGGEEFSAAGFELRTFGNQHALIHPLIPVVGNVGFLINGSLYHPGDSFTVPDGVEVRTLLVPVHAPWSKLSEVVDFVIAVRAPRAFQIHEALLSKPGLDLFEGNLTRLAEPFGTAFRHLALRESVDL
ncbi:MBL fold metallo-hydrolase [Arthrobacter echini]|uniref:MBL fold metallo-hydrolase n=1 Tax=Arthrobacter echini TaxID=1529066 RepID=A0A4V3Z5N0_9MICC|nr:MBL fold metallo-hydrolase [Arthrobacter echini]THJ66169.1 MBL fold metallo-hydrolase [Arthrobacter echini]